MTALREIDYTGHMPRKAEPMTHAQLVIAIRLLCKDLGLWCWIADGVRSTAGCTDLIVLGRGLMFIEVKSDDGRRTKPQVDCAASVAVGGYMYRLYRPADYDSGIIKHELEDLA
jgi:hypothetical protein